MSVFPVARFDDFMFGALLTMKPLSARQTRASKPEQWMQNAEKNTGCIPEYGHVSHPHHEDKDELCRLTTHFLGTFKQA